MEEQASKTEEEAEAQADKIAAKAMAEEKNDRLGALAEDSKDQKSEPLGGARQALGNPSGDKTVSGTTQRTVDLAKGKKIGGLTNPGAGLDQMKTLEANYERGKRSRARSGLGDDVGKPNDVTSLKAAEKRQEKLEKEFEDEEKRRQPAVIDRNIDDNSMPADLPFSNPVINFPGKAFANLVYDTYRMATMVSSFWPGQEMDYKRKNRKYQNFGNRNYGAVGTARGFSPDTLRRAAGLIQEFTGDYDPKFGHAWGDFPYGDDPIDQEQTNIGIRQAQGRLKKK